MMKACKARMEERWRSVSAMTRNFACHQLPKLENYGAVGTDEELVMFAVTEDQVGCKDVATWVGRS